jgi:hypothetical protein
MGTAVAAVLTPTAIDCCLVIYSHTMHSWCATCEPEAMRGSEASTSQQKRTNDRVNGCDLLRCEHSVQYCHYHRGSPTMVHDASHPACSPPSQTEGLSPHATQSASAADLTGHSKRSGARMRAEGHVGAP